MTDQLTKQAMNDNDVFQHAITDGEKPRSRNMFRSVLTIPYTDMQSLLEQMLSTVSHAVLLCPFYNTF